MKYSRDHGSWLMPRSQVGLDGRDLPVPTTALGVDAALPAAPHTRVRCVSASLQSQFRADEQFPFGSSSLSLAITPETAAEFEGGHIIFLRAFLGPFETGSMRNRSLTQADSCCFEELNVWC